jgi:hypothetical protein
MSVHEVPAGLVDRVRTVATSRLRAPVVVTATALEFTPDLTAEEQAMLAEIVQRCQSAVTWSDADWATFKAAYPTLKAFRTRTGSATLAQTQAVLDRVIDCLAAMVRTE